MNAMSQKEKPAEWQLWPSIEMGDDGDWECDVCGMALSWSIMLEQHRHGCPFADVIALDPEWRRPSPPNHEGGPTLQQNA